MDDEEEIPSKPDVDEEEWIREVEKKIDNAFAGSLQWPRPFDQETEPKIGKFTLREEISRPRLVTAGEFSRPVVVSIGPFHWWQKNIGISNKAKWMFVYVVNFLYDLKSEDLARYLREMKNQVKNAHSCYANSDLPKSFCIQDRDNWKQLKVATRVRIEADKNFKRFMEMLLLDSYFILFMLTIQIRKTPAGFTLMPIMPTSTATSTAKRLELFRDDKTKVLDIISNKDDIAPDLLILDNQIPFFAIEELFKELKSDKPLHEYALNFFETIHPRSARDHQNSPPEFSHLLHLFHWSRVPENKYNIELTSPSPQKLDSSDGAHRTPNAMGSGEFPIMFEKEKPQKLDSSDGARRTPNAMGSGEFPIMFEKEKPQKIDSINWARHTPNATELGESATTFKKKTSGSSLDITFRRRRFIPIIRVLDIPELHIRNYSSLIFHNLVAFEMQSSKQGRCTMAFSTLLRSLLQSEEDVKLLRRRGILASSSTTDSELIYLFECLGKLTENHQMPSDLCAICHQVQSHHNHRVSRFCGSVIRQYFPNPLVTLSVLGAAMLFVLTLLQTIYTMIGYYHS